MLALPDRHALLDLVDEAGAGGEGLGAMRGGDDGDEGDVPDLQVPDAVRGGEAQARGGGDLGTDVGEEALGIRVRLVVCLLYTSPSPRD